MTMAAKPVNFSWANVAE